MSCVGYSPTLPSASCGVSAPVSSLCLYLLHCKMENCCSPMEVFTRMKIRKKNEKEKVPERKLNHV